MGTRLGPARGPRLGTNVPVYFAVLYSDSAYDRRPVALQTIGAVGAPPPSWATSGGRSNARTLSTNRAPSEAPDLATGLGARPSRCQSVALARKTNSARFEAPAFTKTRA